MTERAAGSTSGNGVLRVSVRKINSDTCRGGGGRQANGIGPEQSRRVNHSPYLGRDRGKDHLDGASLDAREEKAGW